MSKPAKIQGRCRDLAVVRTGLDGYRRTQLVAVRAALREAADYIDTLEAQLAAVRELCDATHYPTSPIPNPYDKVADLAENHDAQMRAHGFDVGRSHTIRAVRAVIDEGEKHD